MNGWYRIGIVASVVWVLFGAGSQFYASANRTSELRSFLFDDCKDRFHKGLDNGDFNGKPLVIANVRDCVQVSDSVPNEPLRSTLRVAAIVALAPLVIAWPLILLVVFVARWVSRGFRPMSS